MEYHETEHLFEGKCKELNDLDDWITKIAIDEEKKEDKGGILENIA